jgi:multiple sugar transport system substrate-binding protein
MRQPAFALLSLFVAASLVLAACSPTPAAPGASATQPAQATTGAGEPTAAAQPTAESQPTTAGQPGAKTIRLWVMPNGADPDAAIQAEIAAFTAANPDIAVEYEIVGWGDAYGRIQTAVQGGEGPCVTQLGTTWVPTFGTMGGLTTVSADQIAALGGEELFVPASWATAGVEGNVVSVPWFADVRAIAYRADVFEAAGVDPAEAFSSLDSFIAALETIKAAEVLDANGTPIAPFLHPGRNDWNVWQNASMWIWSYGGDLLSADGKQATFNSDEAVEGVTVFDGLYGRGLTSADTLELNSSQADSRFGEGTVATYMTGPWVISQARNTEASGWLPEAAENLAFAAFPPGPGGQYTFVGGSNLAVLKSCADQEAAFTFVEFLTGKESQIRYSTAIGMLPATLEAQNDATFTGDPLFSVFIDAAKTGKTATNIPAWGQVENNLQTALQALWEDVAAAGIGQTIDADTVRQRLDEAANTVNDLLAK